MRIRLKGGDVEIPKDGRGAGPVPCRLLSQQNKRRNDGLSAMGVECRTFRSVRPSGLMAIVQYFSSILLTVHVPIPTMEGLHGAPLREAHKNGPDPKKT